jgi:hypothetical protein
VSANIHAHFRYVLYESALDATVCRYMFGIVVVLSREALFLGLP